MASVTGRIQQIKQPKGGYLKPSLFTRVVFDDGVSLNEIENVHGIIVGLAVDYLTRFITGTEINKAFETSLKGAEIAQNYGIRKSVYMAKKLLAGIHGLDNQSIINACKIVTYDVWARSSNPFAALMATNYRLTKPDEETIDNIRTFVTRSITFFEKFGPITKSGFDFMPNKIDESVYVKMIKTGKGSYGGYTGTVFDGEGDYLTEDTIWDLKVTKAKVRSPQTLQLLMYWIMGQHSGQDCFTKITKIGIFNPRLNTAYVLDTSKVSAEIITAVENEIICY